MRVISNMEVCPSVWTSIIASVQAMRLQYPNGTFFMMGDNRNDSDDSSEWGPLPPGRLIGKAEAIFWPPNRATLRL